MPQPIIYQTSVPAYTTVHGKQMAIRTIPTKAPGATTTLSTGLPLARPVNAPNPPRSAAGSSAVPSLTNGSTSDSRSAAVQSVDVLDMMSDRLQRTMDPTSMDRTIANQAQASGNLNAKQRELAELQAMAQRRLKTARKNFSEGIKAAKEVRKDLEWTQNAVNDLNLKASQKHAAAYKTANERIPARSPTRPS